MHGCRIPSFPFAGPMEMICSHPLRRPMVLTNFTVIILSISRVLRLTM